MQFEAISSFFPRVGAFLGLFISVHGAVDGLAASAPPQVVPAATQTARQDGSALAATSLVRKEWTIAGIRREGLLHVPADVRTRSAAVVFAFHGHGGSMRNAARSFSYHTLWPEAVVVYLQGLNTPGQLTDPEGKKSGWQHAAKNQGDRDLALFDAVLAELRRDYRIDDRRVYATGHSNGGIFTYLLWATRGDWLAAVAPSGAAAPKLVGKLQPKPALHLAGENDPLVKFAWQEQTIAAVLALNQCDMGRPWAPGGKWHDSKLGTPVVVFAHPGGHEFPSAARGAIVAFLRAHAQPNATGAQKAVAP